MTIDTAPAIAVPPPLSVDEVQRAIARVRFECVPPVVTTPGQKLLAAVVGAHPCLGASTIALAIADVIGASEPGVLLVEDVAAPALSAATEADLGEAGGGWRRGRRGSVLIVSRTPRTRTDDRLGEDLPTVVLDLGTRFGAAPEDVPAVVVCRPTVPSIRASEQALTLLPRPTVLASIGPARWPRFVRGCAGPRVSELARTGRVVTFPLDPRLAVMGLTPAPLPRRVLAAARSLIQLLNTDSGGAL